MSKPYTEDELKAAIGWVRDGQFAELLTLAIGLAAETHPELVRKALAKVFDLSAIEEMVTRIMLVASSAQAEAREAASEVRILVDEIHSDIDAVEKRLEWLVLNTEKMAK